MYDYDPAELTKAFARGGSGGNTDSLDALSDKEHLKTVSMAETLAQGQRRIAGLSDGRIVLA
jgi:hypothetical protein